MNLPVTEYYPDDPDQLPPSRRRRARRLLAPLDADERASFLDHLAHRVSPSFDFFFFSLLAGVAVSLGLLLDSAPLLVLAAVLAPVMAPVVGIALGTVLGSVRFFVRSLMGLVIGGLLTFVIGVAAGFASQYWETLKLGQASLYTRVSWANLVVLAVGAIITTAAMTRAEQKPLVSSVALAYELYTPLVVAGFGLGSGVPDLWPDGLLIFAAHLAWAALFGALTLAVMGFRPLTLFGYTLGGAVMLLGVILLIQITSFGAAVGTSVTSPTPSPVIHTATPTPVITLVLPTATPTPTLATPTETLTPAPTDTETPSPTFTPTSTATPMYALVNASEESGGLRLRATPGLAGEIIRLYINGTLIQVLPDTVEADGVIWAHVIVVSDGAEGWMQQYYLLVATPAPNW